MESRIPAHGKAILFAKRDIVISDQFAKRALEEGTALPWPMLGDVPTAGTHVEAGRPLLTIFSDGADVEEVEDRLRSRASEIERSLN
jgi:predicted ATP-grasp superfamily ATP-dependent carboligase